MRHPPTSAALRPLLYSGAVLLALLAVPAMAASGAAPMPASGENDIVLPVLPYGAGYERRLRAARSAAEDSTSAPATAPEKTGPVRNSGFGRGSGSGGSGGGRSR